MSVTHYDAAPPVGRTGRLLVFLTTLLICAAVSLAITPGPMPQSQAYHRFADTRPMLRIPNGANVLSNVAFLLIGLAGLVFLSAGRGRMLANRRTAAALCAGLVLTAAGSAAYHYEPSDRTLFVDRLGMIVVLAAFLTLLLEHFEMTDDDTVLPVALLAGIVSISWWMAMNDLRPYILLHASPIVLVAVGSFISRPERGRGHLWLACSAYFIAKGCESYDNAIYATTGIVSGHTLKHLIAAVSLAIVVKWMLRSTAHSCPDSRSLSTVSSTIGRLPPKQEC